MPIAGFLFGKNVSKSQDASVKMSAPLKKKIEAVVKFIFTLLLTLLTTSVIGILSHDIQGTLTLSHLMLEKRVSLSLTWLFYSLRLMRVVGGVIVYKMCRILHYSQVRSKM